jgi:hypothetical protein
LDVGFSAIELPKHGASSLQQAITRGGQNHLGIPAFEERHTELLFGIAKLMTQGRLREMEEITSASDASGFRYRRNQLQMPDLKIHRGPSSLGT